MSRDYPENQLSWRLAVRPLRDAFCFSGRSTRTEVVAFFLLSLVGNMFAVHAIGDVPPALRVMPILWKMGWTWPWLPLLVRRLHDQDRSSGWAVVSVVQVVALLALYLVPASPTITGLSVRSFLGDSRNVAWSWPSSALISVLAIASVLQLWLFLARGTDGANRYGTDPRLDSGISVAPAHP
ncbi:MAG: DUF805 domain-containing protein [Sphingomonas sp.]|jgi:uncharacterized membrane protein YhaH (DUF805 family)|uniref:DUF805 domain-containing protein n=1 Tax=Sphingomonas sp. TaxID=28214 RepID=UPI003569AC35